jgi:hypothetical protein
MAQTLQAFEWRHRQSQRPITQASQVSSRNSGIKCSLAETAEGTNRLWAAKTQGISSGQVQHKSVRTNDLENPETPRGCGTRTWNGITATGLTECNIFPGSVKATRISWVRVDTHPLLRSASSHQPRRIIHPASLFSHISTRGNSPTLRTTPLSSCLAEHLQ